MTKIVVAVSLALGIALGYAVASTRANAARPGEPIVRYLPTLAAADSGAVTQFCVTDSWTGDSICTPGLMVDACLDEDGQQSTECDVPERKYFLVRGPFHTNISAKLGR